MLMLAGAVLIIAIATSSREGRAKARDSLARYNGIIWAAVAGLWAVLILWR